MTADAMVRSNLSNGPQGLRWDAQNMRFSDTTDGRLSIEAHGDTVLLTATELVLDFAPDTARRIAAELLALADKADATKVAGR